MNPWKTYYIPLPHYGHNSLPAGFVFFLNHLSHPPFPSQTRRALLIYFVVFCLLWMCWVLNFNVGTGLDKQLKQTISTHQGCQISHPPSAPSSGPPWSLAVNLDALTQNERGHANLQTGEMPLGAECVNMSNHLSSLDYHAFNHALVHNKNQPAGDALSVWDLCHALQPR